MRYAAGNGSSGIYSDVTASQLTFFDSVESLDKFLQISDKEILDFC